MSFIRHLLLGIVLAGNRSRVTLLTTENASRHPSCIVLLNEFADLMTLRLAPPVPEAHRLFHALDPFYERQWRHAEALERAITQIGPEDVDFVVLASMESIGLLHLALRPRLFRGKPWGTIAHSIRFHHRRCGIEGPSRWLDVLQRGFFWRVMRDPGLVCFGTLDPYLPEASGDPRVVCCPNACEIPAAANVSDARAAYGVRPETCLVLVFGFIDRRKCVDVLLRGVSRLAPDVDVTVLLAGEQHAGQLAPVLNSEVAQGLREKGRLLEVNRFIDFARDADPIRAADIMWIFYERDFVRTSNVLGMSALAQRPVIARRQGLVGRQVEEHRLGLALLSDAPDDIAAALTTLARDPALRREMGDNGARAFADNTPENFARPIIDAVRHALPVG